MSRQNHDPENYPTTVAEIIDDSITYRPACMAAMRRFRRSKPWEGTFDERAAKLIRLNTSLATAYGIEPPILRAFQGIGAGLDCYLPAANMIRLYADGAGHLSVVTYLHEFGHARGMDERDTCRWSVNLFRKVFPRSFARLEQDGHRLIRVRLALRRPPVMPLTRPARQGRVTVRILERPALPQSGEAGSNGLPSGPMQKVRATSSRSPNNSTVLTHSGH